MDSNGRRHAHHAVAIRVAGVGLALYVVLGAVFLVANSGKAEWFAKFGEGSPYTPYARQVVGPDLAVPLDDGHDGQAFWLLARDPLLLDGRTTVVHFERPAYRSQRILYPLLASPGGLFGDQGIFWALVLVNLGAIFAGGYVTTRLALRLGAPERVGFAFAANPLVMLAFVMDFADALALALLVAVVWALRRRTFGWALAAAVGTVLAKEVGLAAVAALAVAPVAWGGFDLRVRQRASLVGIPAVMAGAWGLWARWHLGWPPSDIQEIVFIPFQGFVDSWQRGWTWAGNYGDALGAALIAVAAVAIVVRWWRRRTPELLAALPFAAMVPFMSIYVVDLTVNLVRVIGPALTFVVVDAYARRPGATTPATTDRSR